MSVSGLLNFEVWTMRSLTLSRNKSINSVITGARATITASAEKVLG